MIGPIPLDISKSSRRHSLVHHPLSTLPSRIDRNVCMHFKLSMEYYQIKVGGEDENVKDCYCTVLTYIHT